MSASGITDRRRSQFWVAIRSNFLPFLLVVSAGLNILLGMNIYDLRSSNELLRQSRKLVLGSKVPNFELYDDSKLMERVNFSSDERPAILYFYSGNCHWCDLNWPSVEAHK